MNVKLKFLIYRCYLAIVLFLVVAAVVLPIVFKPFLSNWGVLVALIGGLFSFVYTVQKQELEEGKLFRELFCDFNHRYDQLSQELNRIFHGDDQTPLSCEDIDTLYRYFNLCGEECLYFNKGYIYPEVWKAWYNGMMIYYQNMRIRKLWSEELKSNSYYGLSFPSADSAFSLGISKSAKTLHESDESVSNTQVYSR